jgi:uncharacterized protein
MRTGWTAAVTVLVCAGLAGCGSAGRVSPTVSGGPVAASTREVSFTAEGTTTYGTLEVPAHRSGSRVAAALLLAGSGPTDRDGNQPPDLMPNTLRQIAGALGRMGIMTLRFDKYFAGRTGPGTYATDPGSIDLNAFIRQADAAYQFLYQQPATDRQRLLVVGHSEGGLYAMLVAGSVSAHPAGLALVEPQDQRLLDLVAVQITELLDAQVSQGAITAATAQDNARAVQRAIGQFRVGHPVDTTGLLPSVLDVLRRLILNPGNARYVRADDAVDPPTVAAKLPTGTRVLVTDGTADFNVPPSTIRPLINALASAGTTGPGLKTLTGLDHDLHPKGTPPNGGALDPTFLTALQDWAQPYAA